MPDRSAHGASLIRQRSWIGIVVPAVYVVLSVVTLWVWGLRGVYPLIGDEPHYLVIGDALWRFGGIDVLLAYESELSSRVFYPPGLGEVGSQVTSYGHVVPGDRGTFSWHGYLLGWVAGLPVALFGVEAARWSMVVIGAGIAFVVWWAAGVFFASSRVRLLVSLTLVVTYPFLLASFQIFPDFVAGGLALLGIAWLMRSSQRPSGSWPTVLVAFPIALLPWLGIKFAPVAAVLLLAMVWRSRNRWWLVVAPAAISAALLMAFNAYAYGSPFGSLSEGTVEFGGDFWIRLAGMLVDQNQGVLLFNPILWLGLAGLVPFWRRDRLVGSVWSLVFGLLWVLGAAHPGWFGGGSFMGRYSWGMALLLMLPAMVTLAALLRRSFALFWVALGASLAFSAWMFILGVFVSDAGPGVPLGLDFYNKPMGNWLDSYSVLWFPLQDFFAALYNPVWAWSYGVNYVWLVLALLAGILGAVRVGLRGLLVAGVGALVAVIASGMLSSPGERSVREVQDAQVAAGLDQPGVIAGGPVWLMRDGTYEWSITYSAEPPPVDVAGRWELVRAMDEQVVATGELPGTSGEMEQVMVPVAYRNLSPRQFFLRVFWNGNGSVEVYSTSIRHGSLMRWHVSGAFGLL